MSKAGRPSIKKDNNFLILLKQSLDKYKDILFAYKQKYTDYVDDYQNLFKVSLFDNTEPLNPLIYETIKSLLSLPEWKINYYILMIHFGGDYIKELCNDLKVDRNDLIELKKEIKKDIKSKL